MNDYLKDKLFHLDGFRCHYCQRWMNNSSATFDHKIPRSRGGTNHISNIVLACAPCNNAKGSMTDDEFFEISYEHREIIRKAHLRAGYSGVV